MFNSNKTLTLLDSYATLSPATFEANPLLTESFSMQARGPFTSRIVENNGRKLLFVGYEGFYASKDNLYLQFVTYDITNGKLEEKSRVYNTKGSGCNFAVPSINPDKPFLISSTYRSTGTQGHPAYAPHIFDIEIYRYNPDGTVVTPPVAVLPLSTLVPDFYNTTISYAGLIGLSEDGKYILITWSTPSPTGGLLSQKMGLFTISHDLTTLTMETSYTLQPTEKPGLIGFPQGVKVWKSGVNSYHIVSFENSYNLVNPRGTTAQIVYYHYKVGSSIEMKAQAWVPQYIEGFDVDTDSKIIYVGCNRANLELSTEVVPRPPFDNPAVDKGKALRVYRLKGFLGKINGMEYVAGEDINSECYQIKASPDGNTVAMITNTSYADQIFPAPPGTFALSPVGRRSPPSTLLVYDVNRLTGKLTLFGQSAAAPLTFAVTFTADSKILSVSGMGSYSKLATIVAGQIDNQLYEIDTKRWF